MPGLLNRNKFYQINVKMVLLCLINLVSQNTENQYPFTNTAPVFARGKALIYFKLLTGTQCTLDS